MHYYNEFNKESAEMLKVLMLDGLIPHGFVDTRPIQEVNPYELKEYTQCHFFAGIGGWAFALEQAGWPEDRPVWTGSCPCQPFSSAGRHRGKEDERHLWPVWFSLIKQCKPATVFGEQVEAAVAKGWLDDVYKGLEAENYAVGAAVLPASSVGTPHKRNRLWFVAKSNSVRQSERPEKQREFLAEQGDGQSVDKPSGRSTTLITMGDPKLHGQHETPANRSVGEGKEKRGMYEPERPDTPCIMGYTESKQSDISYTKSSEEERRKSGGGYKRGSFWRKAMWIECPDEKQRFAQPSVPLLVDGFQHRRPILHALGNAIVPQVAAEFIKASM